MYVGRNQCIEADIGGGFISFDKHEGGNLDLEGGEQQYNIGTGGQVGKWRDMATPNGTANTSVQTLNLLNFAKPAAIGDLPPKIDYIQGGTVAVLEAAVKQSDCYLNQVALSCGETGVLMCVYNWRSLRSAPVNIAAAQAKQANSLIARHTADAQFDVAGAGLAGYKIQSWTATLVNEITAQSSQDGKAADIQRMPEWFDPGAFRVSLSARIRTPLGVNLALDYPGQVEFLWSGTDNEAVPKTFTLDLTGGNGLDLNRAPFEIVSGSDAVLWGIEATAEPDDLAVWATTFV